MKSWPIVISLEGRDEDFEIRVFAPDVKEAVGIAIDACQLLASELIHMIHIGPPKEVER